MEFIITTYFLAS